MQPAEQIIRRLEAAGFRAAFLPISALEQVAQHYGTLRNHAADIAWLRKSVAHFRNYQPPKLPFVPQSILMIAYPAQGQRWSCGTAANALKFLFHPPTPI